MFTMHGPNGQVVQGTNLSDIEEELDLLENLHRDEQKEKRRQQRQGPLQVWRLAKQIFLNLD